MRYFKHVAIAALMGLLVACGSTAPRVQEIQPIEAAALSDDGAIAIATLAPLGSFEWRVAPSFTRSALLRRNAERQLRRHELSFDRGAGVLAATDRARAALDAAVKADAAKDVLRAEKLAKEGADALDEAEAILRGE